MCHDFCSEARIGRLGLVVHDDPSLLLRRYSASLVLGQYDLISLTVFLVHVFDPVTAHPLLLHACFASADYCILIWMIHVGSRMEL